MRILTFMLALSLFACTAKKKGMRGYSNKPCPTFGQDKTGIKW